MTWFKEGLRFGCTQCGKCCTGAPGYVWITEEDIRAMAEFLQISTDEFTRRYTRCVFDRIALLENASTYDCVFLKDKKCRVYGARPKQCRRFPWWPEHVKTPEAWREAEAYCEGINHPDAPLISFDEIQKHLSE